MIEPPGSRRSVAVAVALLAGVVAAIAPAGPAAAVVDAGRPWSPRPRTVAAVRVAGRPPAGRLGIGDSVMLGARTELRARGIRVDAVVSRQFDGGVRLVRSMAAAGTLPRTVIVHLGNNGYLEREDCDRLARSAGPRRDVYLVTLKVPRGWRSVNNHRLRSCARANGNAHLIGWYAASEDRPAWFAADGYHLTGPGARAYARLIRRLV